jgi:hypothetical protein
VRRNIAFAATAGTRSSNESIARFPSTPLVLEAYAPDFSTEAGNSDLIKNNEILAQPALAAKQKQ